MKHRRVEKGKVRLTNCSFSLEKKIQLWESSDRDKSHGGAQLSSITLTPNSNLDFLLSSLLSPFSILHTLTVCEDLTIKKYSLAQLTISSSYAKKLSTLKLTKKKSSLQKKKATTKLIFGSN